MSDRSCVMSLGINSPMIPDHPPATFQDFSRGLARIASRLEETGFDGDFLSWDREYPPGSPRHEEVRFAFKPFCFRDAASRGYRYALFLDAAVDIVSSVDPVFEAIRDQGYFFVTEGHSVGEFTRDAALATLGITREESFRLTSAWGNVIGLDLEHERSVRFLDEWTRLATDGISFHGPKWSGVRGFPRTASQDPRVKGHRCQSVMTVLALREGMDQWWSKRQFRRVFRADRNFVRRFDEGPPPPRSAR